MIVRTHLHDGRHVVLDAEREADLAIIAAVVRTVAPRLLVACGGLARHLWPEHEPVQPAVGPASLLVVVGSHHPTARAQLAHLLRTGPARLIGSASPLESSPPAGAEVLVLATPDRQANPETALRDLGGALEEVMSLGRPGAMFVTGGETALHALGAMGAHALDVAGELEPGIPLGSVVGGPFAGLTLALKAGGFGRRELLTRVAERLRRSPTSTPAE